MPVKKIDTFPTLETARLQLRSIRDSDAPEVFAIRSNKINQEYIDRQPPQSLDDAVEHIHKVINWYEENGWINWTITLKGEDKVIGFIGYWNFHDTIPQVEIGYELHPDYVGEGIMSEATKAVLNFGFEEMGIETVVAHLHKENERSLSLLQRFNFVHNEKFLDKEEPEMVLWELRKADFYT